MSTEWVPFECSLLGGTALIEISRPTAIRFNEGVTKLTGKNGFVDCRNSQECGVVKIVNRRVVADFEGSCVAYKLFNGPGQQS